MDLGELLSDDYNQHQQQGDLDQAAPSGSVRVRRSPARVAATPKRSRKRYRSPSCGVEKCRLISLVICLMCVVVLAMALTTPSWYHKPGGEALGLWRHEYRNYSIIYPKANYPKYQGEKYMHIQTFSLTQLNGFLKMTAELLLATLASATLTVLIHFFIPLVVVMTLTTGALGMGVVYVFGQEISARVHPKDLKYLSWSFHLVVLATILYIVDGIMLVVWCAIAGRKALAFPRLSPIFKKKTIDRSPDNDREQQSNSQPPQVYTIYDPAPSANGNASSVSPPHGDPDRYTQRHVAISHHTSYSHC